MNPEKRYSLSTKFQNKTKRDQNPLPETEKSSFHLSNKNLRYVSTQFDISPRNSTKKSLFERNKKEMSVATSLATSKKDLPLILLNLPNKPPEGSNSIKKPSLIKSSPEIYKVCETSPSQSPSVSTFKRKQTNNNQKNLSITEKYQSQSPVRMKKLKNSPPEKLEKVLPKKAESTMKLSSFMPTPIIEPVCFTEANQSTWLTSDSFSKGHYAISQPGKLLGNITKENQDAFVLMNELFGFEACSIFGVMDGHGTNGHKVSSFIKQGAIDYFSAITSYKGKNKKELTEASIYEKLTLRNYQFITSFYSSMEERLRLGKFDVHYSGSTCVMIYVLNGKLICSNVGDSRALLVKQNAFGVFDSEQLSTDHKPCFSSEQQRITSMGGLVKKDTDCGGQEGVYRIWIKNGEGPGIAISRTLGDVVAKTVGVIPIPEIVEKQITPDMCYVVACSDGIWDFIDNTKVMSIINPFYIKDDAKGACTALVHEATKLWMEEGGVIDDITCIIHFLKPHKRNEV